MQPDKCCGNSPPDTVRYGLGLGMQPLTFTDLGQTFELKNQKFGDLELKQWWWAIAVAANIAQAKYSRIKEPDIALDAKYWDITTPVKARAYAVQSGFALDLSWSTSMGPTVYVRPIDE